LHHKKKGANRRANGSPPYGNKKSGSPCAHHQKKGNTIDGVQPHGGFGGQKKKHPHQVPKKRDKHENIKKFPKKDQIYHKRATGRFVKPGCPRHLNTTIVKARGPPPRKLESTVKNRPGESNANPQTLCFQKKPPGGLAASKRGGG